MLEMDQETNEWGFLNDTREGGCCIAVFGPSFFRLPLPQLRA